MSLFTLPELATALKTDNPVTPSSDHPITGVSIDTRTLQKGDLFIALAGTPSGGFTSSFNSGGDGHQYLKMAQDKGAAAAIVSTPNPALALPQLVVADTLMDGLWPLGAYARARLTGTLIALTGSAGKTTTKEMLAAMLNAPASVGSYNNFWGVPLTLARIPASSEYAVAELGMNQPGEIARLSQLAKPNVALVVNVHPVHLEHLGSLDAIRQEKLSIAQGLQPGGTLVVPASLSLAGCPWQGRVVTFGEGGDVHATGHHAHGEDWHVTANVAGQGVEFTLREGAPHRLHNAIAALAAVYAAGANVTAAAANLAHAGTLAGRGTAQVAGGVTVVDDSFNGNPASMAAALQSLAGRQVKGRKIALLGDMLELGDEAPAYHAALVEHTGAIDGVYAVGPLMRHLYNALPAAKQLGYVEDPVQFNPAAFAATLHPGDAVVLKGSKKMLHAHNIAARLVAALAASAA